MDARIEGLDMLSKFLELFYPDLLDIVQDQLIESLEKEQEFKRTQEETNQIELFGKQELYFNQVFDLLIQYNSKQLLEKYPILNLEYHLDGFSKTDEEILLQKDENNYLLLNDIIKNRNKFIQEPVQFTESHKLK